MKYDKQDTINRIAILRANNTEWEKVADRLNTEGYRTKQANKFNKNSAAIFYRRTIEQSKAAQKPKGLNTLDAFALTQPAPIPALPTAAPPVDIRDILLATLDFKIPAQKKIDLLRTILA